MKKIVTVILTICLALSLFPHAIAAESFTINNVTVDVSSGSDPGNCSSYASTLLKKIWTIGRTIMTTYTGQYNLIKGLNTSDRTITEDHTKNFIQNTPLGSRIRICASSDTSGNDYDNNRYGHTLVLVARNDAAGKFTVLEGGQGGVAKANEYTYSSFVTKKNASGYKYFYYIADYSAAERDYKNKTNTGVTPISTTPTNKITITYNPNGGRVSPTTQVIEKGSNPQSLPIATRDGYRFLGWFLNGKAEWQITENTSWAYLSDLTLFALWEQDERGSGHWEYRYVGYATSDGKHECWCETYLKNKFGSANLRYSDWSTTQYSTNGSSWTCGSGCGGNHTGIARQGNNGVPYWSEYTLPDGKNYYWEETRWVEDSEPLKTFSVTLDDGSVCSQITVINGGTYSNLTTPSRDGYTFDGWYTQQTGGTKVTTSTKVNLTGDQTLYAHWKQISTPLELPEEKPSISSGHWGPWSDWSKTRYYESETRQVEPEERTEQIQISEGYTEYRYVGYATSDGKHECWCETYLRNKFGSANLRYSDWSATRYSVNGSGWTCGRCNGNHINVDHYTSDGRAWWGEYTLPGGKNYYWEESRTVDPQYETRTVTFYRYRDWIVD